MERCIAGSTDAWILRLIIHFFIPRMMKTEDVPVVGVVWALSLDCEWFGWVCDAAEVGQH